MIPEVVPVLGDLCLPQQSDSCMQKDRCLPLEYLPSYQDSYSICLKVVGSGLLFLENKGLGVSHCSSRGTGFLYVIDTFLFLCIIFLLKTFSIHV